MFANCTYTIKTCNADTRQRLQYKGSFPELANEFSSR